LKFTENREQRTEHRMTQNLGLKTQEKYLPQVDELQIIIINVRDGLLQWMSKYLRLVRDFARKWGLRRNLEFKI